MRFCDWQVATRDRHSEVLYC